MAGSFNNDLESEVLEHLFGSSAFTPTTVFWAALYSASPGEAGSSTAEISGNGYTRVSYQNNSSNWPAANPKLNAGAITFPVATGTGWGSVTHMALVSTSASTAPAFYVYADLTTPKTIDGGDTASFAASAISIALD